MRFVTFFLLALAVLSGVAMLNVELANALGADER
jgi:hypothetical protein